MPRRQRLAGAAGSGKQCAHTQVAGRTKGRAKPLRQPLAMAAAPLQLAQSIDHAVANHQHVPGEAIAVEMSGQCVQQLPVERAAGLLRITQHHLRAAIQRGVGCRCGRSAADVAVGQVKTLGDLWQIGRRLAQRSLPATQPLFCLERRHRQRQGRFGALAL